MLVRDPKAAGLEDVLVRALGNGPSREGILKSLDELETPQQGLKPLLERLWERVEDANVREQLRMILSRISVDAEKAAEEKTQPA
jgi:hypothetical protein